MIILTSAYKIAAAKPVYRYQPTGKGGTGMAYETKDFAKLIGMEGFSEQLLRITSLSTRGM
jgi:hypothetical protein